MRYALFLGCTIPARSRNYELSARKVAMKLGIEFVDLEQFICCGFPIRNSDLKSSIVLGAYNLALAQKKGLDVCTLCSSCTSALTEVAHQLSEDKDMRGEINKRLSNAGLQYEGDVKIRHFARILYEEIGSSEIEKHFTKDLKGLRIASHYGCHYLKPSEIYGNFDSPGNPKTLDKLISITGAKIVDYMNKTRCCGGPLLPVDDRSPRGELDENRRRYREREGYKEQDGCEGGIHYPLEDFVRFCYRVSDQSYEGNAVQFVEIDAGRHHFEEIRDEQEIDFEVSAPLDDSGRFGFGMEWEGHHQDVDIPVSDDISSSLYRSQVDSVLRRIVGDGSYDLVADG